MSQVENTFGWIYLFLQVAVLPTLLTQLNQSLPVPMGSSQLNFLFFVINFLAVCLIFRNFLRNARYAVRRHFVRFLVLVALGFLTYVAYLFLFEQAVLQLRPGYINLNDQGIGSMAGSSFLLMAIGTVILVPPVEECFYRGLVLGNLCGRNTAAAYLVSASLFALIHIVGFLGIYSSLDFLLAFLQYLPAGLILAWTYQKTGTIFTPICIHALVNLRGIWLVR